MNRENIIFSSGINATEVLRLSKDGIWANPDIPVDDAAKFVLNAIGHNIKVLVEKAVSEEREACARVCDDINAIYKWPQDTAERVASQWCADAIRLREKHD